MLCPLQEMSEETTSTSVESHSDVEMMTGEQQRASSPAGQAVSDRENPSPTTPTPLSPATQQKGSSLVLTARGWDTIMVCIRTLCI